MPKAVIVGAGINGLCTARALHRRGWAVEVVEAGPVPNPQAASWDRHRMFRVHYPEPEMAARMRDALAAWEALWLDLGRSHYVERGTLALSRTAGDWSERTGTALAAVGAPLEQIEVAELSLRFPMLETAGVRYGLWSPAGRGAYVRPNPRGSGGLAAGGRGCGTPRGAGDRGGPSDRGGERA